MQLLSVTAAIAATLSMVQFCPAPPAVLGPIIAGALISAGEAGAMVGYGVGKINGKRDVAVSGSIKGSVFRKRDDPFAGLPQPAADTCKEQLNGVTVEFQNTGEGSFRANNIPSACMTLSNVIIGQDPLQPAPTPLGSDSLEYTGLSEEDLNKLQSALDGNGY
ncbi:hypothetical protein ASPSYDRAFT_33945 [Aspergillus sydowii CBS 593.65]|uniref:Uncharacterized protein n=1 Tax=Aspergillus sydowii CBS 593.65 TaxID=1036612 RepID=A0A1L9T993_9EURO|nr:uncharacterized protein ASPSYDRAFT_33945 [Aspergillus sydowii CBS 593.65]OJJ55935.1 hypothetical protein ASPSYDRAFT_33945 [Aspergillus sydowii CBS 593.65]